MILPFYNSAELRWFLEGDKADFDKILQWFCLKDRLPVLEEAKISDYDRVVRNRPFVKQEEKRSDEYLLFPETDKAGVKTRSGRLEIKILTTGPRPFRLRSCELTGRMDQWVKWSFASSDAEKFEGELRSAAPWQKVIKERYLLKYWWDSDKVIVVPPDQRPDCGCNVELTIIETKTKRPNWLSIGFEAFGPSEHVVHILDVVTGDFFSCRGFPPVKFRYQDSISYPAWLACLL
ncbi:MAG: hypothetical protein JOY96_08525 [Verrucomicrobia bacterium]|nr:hypothetical protein [Verrucomicrobiota bacterium]